MTQDSKEHVSDDSQQNESELFVMIKKIQQHLVFLERKIDSLIQQSPSGPRREGHFSKPRRPFGHSHRPGRGKPEGRFHSEGRPAPDRRFDKPGEIGNRPFFSKKKRFFRHEEN